MKEQTTSKIYAQSFIELGNEANLNVADELTKLTEVINASNDLENVLFLDVFSSEEKKAVLEAVANKINLAPLVIKLVNYLITEKRVNLLPLITKEVIVYDDHVKGFLRGVIEGSEDSIKDEDIKKLKEIIKSRLGKEPTLTYQKNENVTAGFRVTVEDLQLDASLDSQLESFKQSVLGE